MPGFPGGSDGKQFGYNEETRVRSLGWEDPLGKGMVIHFSNLAWRIPWAEKPGGDSPWGHKEFVTTETTNTVISCEALEMQSQ